MARRLMRPADLALLRWAQDPQPSPDGSRLAWCEISFDTDADQPVMRVMVADVEGGEAPRQFSDGPADFSPRWSADGRHLAYLSVADDVPCARLAPLSGGAALKVEAPGPVTWLEWSPKGDRLVLVVKVGGRPPGDSAVKRNAPIVVRGLSNRMDGEGFHSGRNHLFVYELPTGSLRQLTRGDFDHAFPTWSPDGQRLAFVSDRSEARDDRAGFEDLWTMAVGGGHPSRLTRGVGSPTLPLFSPDGSKVAFVGTQHAADQFDRDDGVWIVDSAGGGVPERLAPGLDRPAGVSFGSSRPYAWLSDDELVFNVADAGALGIARARLGATRPREVVTGDMQVLGLAVSGRGRARRLAYEAAWVDQPSEIFVTSLAGGATRRLSRAADALLESVELLPACRLQARAPDGLGIEYFLMRPRPRGARRGRPSQAPPPPLFLDIHGGPALYNPISFLLPLYQVLTAAGYALVLPNPRGSIGYGEAFRRLAMHDWGGDDFGDLMACADDAIDRGFADARRQFVGGYSYGGFMTSWVLGHTDRFRAAIVGAPVVDQVSMFGTTDVPTFLAAAIGRDPWLNTDAFRYRSPLSHLEKATTPVLLHVNEGDLRCPPGQADQLHSALRWLGKEVEYVRYPGGSHLAFFPQIGAPSQSIDRMERFLGFLARHGGPARP